ncbi:MAG: hypothetical protein M1821_005903 [Bathelium mastoideum]|nr:MAG: hypothetical protein M1821_005903 [Bathelium mastoideum]KAI9688559.1 MAG: hypothetical protein M1822_001508 [Bathelium mastoideum]
MNFRGKPPSPPPSIHSSPSEPCTRSSSPIEDGEIDADTAMSSGDDASRSSRPLSVAIPEQDPSSASGPYCPMRPRLADILANTAPPPWTLSAFMAYLSQNHCLETLEFTMDAGRYRKHYHRMLNRATGGVMQPDSSECQYLRMLWSRLLEAYIRPSGEREVNLPSDVRDDLLGLPNDSIPPAPESLDLAVRKINELMEDSVLYPFLNSFDEHVAHMNTSSTNVSIYTTPSEENLARSSASTAHRFSSRRRTTPPPASTRDPSSSPQASSRNVFSSRHISAPPSSGLSASLHRLSPSVTRTTQASSASSSGTASGAAGTPAESTDDSGGADSPFPSGELMTPPTTPPTSEYGGGGGDVSPPNIGTPSAGGSSPRSSRDGNPWKKSLSKLGWKKKSVHGLSNQDEVLKEEDSSMDIDP